MIELLAASQVIHTVGPMYDRDMHGQDAELAEAVEKALVAAEKAECLSVRSLSVLHVLIEYMVIT